MNGLPFSIASIAATRALYALSLLPRRFASAAIAGRFALSCRNTNPNSALPTTSGFLSARRASHAFSDRLNCLPESQSRLVARIFPSFVWIVPSKIRSTTKSSLWLRASTVHAVSPMLRDLLSNSRISSSSSRCSILCVVSSLDRCPPIITAPPPLSQKFYPPLPPHRARSGLWPRPEV